MSISLNRTFISAALYMMASAAMFSLMNNFMRLASDSMHSSLIVSWRNILAIGLLLPLVLYAGKQATITQRPWGHFWRALVGMLGMQLWTYSIISMDLTVATALSFTAPLFASILAVLFLRESSDITRWVCLFVGFCGTLIILKPDISGGFEGGAIVLLTTTLWATTGIMVKSLTRTEPALRILWIMTCLMTVFSIPFAVPIWRMPNMHELTLLACVAVTSLMAHFCMVKAYSLATVVSLMPFDFTRLLFTSIFAYAFFAESLSTSTAIGGAVVLGSAFYTAQRDARMRRTDAMVKPPQL